MTRTAPSNEGERKSSNCYQIIISVFLAGCLAFTNRNEEVRAWTIKSGISALKAAGKIHSDMEQGFIKADVYTFNELMQYKSELALKDAGRIRQEGKNYIVQDGDIIFFKFNV